MDMKMKKEIVIHNVVEYGNAVRKLRREAGLSQREFAELCGVGLGTVTNIETYRKCDLNRAHVVKTRERISEGCGVTFVYESDEEEELEPRDVKKKIEESDEVVVAEIIEGVIGGGVLRHDIFIGKSSKETGDFVNQVIENNSDRGLIMVDEDVAKFLGLEIGSAKILINMATKLYLKCSVCPASVEKVYSGGIVIDASFLHA